MKEDLEDWASCGDARPIPPPSAETEMERCEICRRYPYGFGYQVCGCTARPVSPTAPAEMPTREGTWPIDCVQRAFVDGAAWWEFESTGGTIWGADRNRAEAEAVKRFGEPTSVAPTADFKDLLDAFHIAAQRLNVAPELVHNSVTGQALERRYSASRKALEDYVARVEAENQRLRGVIFNADEEFSSQGEHNFRLLLPKTLERARSILSAELSSLQDDPERDGTNDAHPAWWRGNDRGVEATVEALNKVLDSGRGGGTFGFKPLEELASRLSSLRSSQITAEEARWLYERRFDSRGPMPTVLVSKLESLAGAPLEGK